MGFSFSDGTCLTSILNRHRSHFNRVGVEVLRAGAYRWSPTLMGSAIARLEEELKSLDCKTLVRDLPISSAVN